MITNELGLPLPLVEAVANDPYEKGDCHFSATELIAPPHMKLLQKRHKDAISVDASDRIWSLLGQSVHGVLERAATLGYIMERRYIGTFGVGGVNVRVGAKIDVLDSYSGTLDDYKVTSVYKFKSFNGQVVVVPEYERQMNIQAECIFQETGKEIQKARIIGILRDWRRSEAAKELGYPKHMIGVMEVPIWPHERRVEYIKERVKLHMLPDPEPCSAEETWEKPRKWALMKVGQKRAVRLYDDRQDADRAAVAYGDIASVEERPGGRTRCESYCEVSEFCEPYKKYKEVAGAT